MSAALKKKAPAVQVTKPSDRTLRVEREFDAARDRVWRAFTEPKLLAQWWGRGRPVKIERMELERGGHWRFIVPSEHGDQGFEGRYREITPKDRIVHTFEWDGMPGHVVIETITFVELGGGRTRVVNESLFHTAEECAGMASSGMEEGVNDSYAALDDLLAGL